ncbi:hypothetical protein [Burkholderia cenocepacia]|uniref:hypothetical protein n=1 Tax=Burkholderia cenocepacia TaxID=95486 RepID=UPI001CF31788|nr:hypothetical protein [Burkholderia cenocepacia]MCA8237071.1 hypothetical protein [Burkholderia cenocepacia]
MLMGFSRGGQATLYAAMTRLNRLWNTSGQTVPHVGGNAQARDAAIADVMAYLKTALGGGGDAPGD